MAWQDRPYYRDEGGGNIPPVVFSFPKLTRLTMSVMGTCLVLFIIQSVMRGTLEYWGSLTFTGGRAFTQPWRWITYQYLHGGAGHFFFNMIVLYFFLPSLELMWGWKKAFAFYTAGGIVSGITYGVLTLIAFRGRDPGLIGASGSILAAMGAVALLNPNRQLILVFFPLPIRVAVALIGAFYLLSALADRSLSNAAHLGGLAFGFFAPWIAGPWMHRFRRNWEKSRARREAVAERDEQETIDRILQKVHEKGMNSLSWSEKRTLKRATERQRQTEVARRAR
jgi:membrane associated rhomboid family serine protease